MGKINLGSGGPITTEDPKTMVVEKIVYVPSEPIIVEKLIQGEKEIIYIDKPTIVEKLVPGEKEVVFQVVEKPVYVDRIVEKITEKEVILPAVEKIVFKDKAIYIDRLVFKQNYKAIVFLCAIIVVETIALLVGGL